MALLKYHKVTNDNLKEYIFHKEATPKNIIELLYTIIDNPISMYYENLSCLATTYEEKSSFTYNVSGIGFQQYARNEYCGRKCESRK